MNRVVLNKGIIINNFNSKAEAVEVVLEHWKKFGYSVVNYIYWSNYTLTKSDKSYSDALKSSDFILPDGIGMYLYGKYTLNTRINNLNGTDVNPLFLKAFAERNIPVALYGAAKVSISRAVHNIKNKNIQVYYFQDGFSSLDWNKINDNSVLMVGLGSPKQERWAADNIELIKQKRLLVITVGGFFDFQSGKYKRAPMLIRRLGLEWVWRLPNCGIKKNLRNFYILYYILRDYKTIRNLNKS